MYSDVGVKLTTSASRVYRIMIHTPRVYNSTIPYRRGRHHRVIGADSESMEHLPDELLLYTMSFLSTRDLTSIRAASVRHRREIAPVSRSTHHARVRVCASDYCFYRQYIFNDIDPCVRLRHTRSCQSGLCCVTNMFYRILWLPWIAMPLLAVLFVEESSRWSAIWYNFLDDRLYAILFLRDDTCLCRVERSRLRTSCLYNLAMYTCLSLLYMVSTILSV